MITTRAEEFVASLGADIDEHPVSIMGDIADAIMVPGTDEPIDELRWSIIRSVVYRFDDGSFIRFIYDSPATEYQDGQPWNSNAHVVMPREVTSTIYVPIGTIGGGEDGSEGS